MATADPVALLLDLVHALEHRQPAPEEVRAWVLQGLRTIVRDGASVGAALGLECSGRRSLARRLAQVERDQHIARAIEAVALDPTVTDWERCGRLAAELPAFVNRAWPVARRMGTIPDGWPTWKRHLGMAAAACDGIGATLPTSRRSLWRVVTRDPACSCH